MYLRHLSSLQFLTYAGFFAVVIAAIFKFMPGKAPPLREEPYPPEELHAHDAKTTKYFVAGGAFLTLGALHMVLKNLPWTARWLAGAGYAGHLVRDLSNTHVMIVGGGTLIATGLVWYCLPRIGGRPLSSEGLAQCAFWFTVAGLAVFYVALIGNGIAMGRLMEHGWSYPAAKAHMGNWYKAPAGAGAGVMGLGYWCFAANVLLTVFHSRLVRVPKPASHLWRYMATGAAALTVGTVQGVIQVQPGHADWLYRAGHAGEWIDPISHAHINLVTGLAMLVAGALFALAPSLGGTAPSARTANRVFTLLLVASLSFYGVCLYLGFHEGSLVVGHGLTPEQAEEATPLHPWLLMGAGIAMLAAFWLLLATILRTYRRARAPMRHFVLAGCTALFVGTLQGPIQAFPAVNGLLDRGGDPGDVIVNLHAQLNMLGGLMVMLVGLALAVLIRLGGAVEPRAERRILRYVPAGVGLYYAGGIAFAAVEAHRVSQGRGFREALAALEPWQALVLVPASLAVLVGFGSFAGAAWRMSAAHRAAGRAALAGTPAAYTGRIPRHVQRRSPASVAAYELPLGILGFPGLGWLFAGYPLQASFLLTGGPALTWAAIPAAFSPYGAGPLRGLGWKLELVWLPLSTLVSASLLYRAHARRKALLEGRPPRGRRERPRRRRLHRSYRTRVAVSASSILLLLVALPFVPAVAGIGSGPVRYSYAGKLTSEISGQFLTTPKGLVKLFSWSDPQATYPTDALRLHAQDLRSLVVRAAAVDSPAGYQLYDLSHGGRIPLAVDRSSHTSLTLAPRRSLRPGRYAFLATHEGMFGGRDFAYVTVVAPGAPVSEIVAGSTRTAPAVARAILPVASALVALAFCLLLLRSLRRRPAGQKALWAVGFGLFALASTAEAVAHRTGWTPGLFRSYYLAGGVLSVAYLGAGSAWLLLPRRARDLLLGALALATVAAAVSVVLAPVDGHLLASTATGSPPANGALGGHAFLWAIALNTFGTVFLVGGSLWSIARRQRVRANIWIGGGAAVVALATGLSRAGTTDFVYLGQLVGIALMFAGFTLTSAAPVKRRAAAPAAVVTPAR
ncbi:MAG: hypothetical protein QOE36_3793 [Gaiellaceae bacterium]|nr:hypothetical protein [Gaiellaceae bacterium]